MKRIAKIILKNILKFLIWTISTTLFVFVFPLVHVLTENTNVVFSVFAFVATFYIITHACYLLFKISAIIDDKLDE